jgi:hypothetical protein
MTDSISAHGVSVGVPRGWEAELGTLDGEETSAGGFALQSTAAAPRVLLHLANFALPAVRGDYGSGAVEMMDSGSVMIMVLEFDRPSAGTALFKSAGIPGDLEPDDFSPNALQRPQRNQSGVQRFFHLGDRAFCLYVVLGSHRARGLLVPEANRLLATLTID